MLTRKFLAFAFFVVMTPKVIAQSTEMGPEKNWGVIHLTDGSSLEGQLQFYNTLRVRFIHKSGNSENLSPDEINGFEFYDRSVSRMRKFSAMPFKQYENSVPVNCFMEILMELNSFAILSRTEFFETQSRRSKSAVLSDPVISRLNPGGESLDRSHVLERRSETIYLLNALGELEPYYTLTKEKRQKFWDDDQKNSLYVIDKKLIRRHSGGDYNALSKYAKENNLNFFHKEHLIKILEHYRLLLSLK
jgi:hypothetical protein